MRPRIRSIKPDIASDEELWDLGQQSGLPVFQAFTMLWCSADREGRFEWRPRALKALCTPYWDGDFARVLDALAACRFVVKYTVDGRDYGLVRTFKRHQVINNREAESVLPAPPEHHDDACSTRAVRDDDVLSTREPRLLSAAQAEGKGTEGNGKEGDGVRAAARVHLLPPRQVTDLVWFAQLVEATTEGQIIATELLSQGSKPRKCVEDMLVIAAQSAAQRGVVIAAQSAAQRGEPFRDFVKKVWDAWHSPKRIGFPQWIGMFRDDFNSTARKLDTNGQAGVTHAK